MGLHTVKVEMRCLHMVAWEESSKGNGMLQEPKIPHTHY